MPIFSYFLIVGSVLSGVLLWFGNENEPIGTALTSSQMVGTHVIANGRHSQI
jgi:hypothetical protein